MNKIKNFTYDEALIMKGLYMLQTRNTIRGVAMFFNESKTTVHRQLHSDLWEVDPGLAEEVDKLLKVNQRERSARGGEATRQKFLKYQKCQSK